MAGKEPYGDVHYADPGFQADKKKRYPVDTAEHVRAAWSYINKGSNSEAYTTEQLSHIKDEIRTAAHKFGIEIGDSKSVYVDVKLSEASLKAITEQIKAAGGSHAPGMGGDRALLQAAHDAMVHLGAVCFPLMSDEDSTGSSDGANKSFITVDGQAVRFETINAARDFFAEMLKSIDDAEKNGEELIEVTAKSKTAEVKDIDAAALDDAFEQFKGNLTALLTPQDPPTETPADPPADEAAAASDEEPAPAEAAEDAAEEVDPDMRARDMAMALFAAQPIF